LRRRWTGDFANRGGGKPASRDYGTDAWYRKHAESSE
jgi:hypothetical protein